MEVFNYNNIFDFLHKKYYEIFNDIKLPIKIDVTDNMNESHFTLRPDLKERLIDQGIINEIDYNGRLVLPRNVGDNIHVLLNNRSIKLYTEDLSFTWIGTYAHEITHAIDYHHMSIKEGLISYDPLLEIKDYQMFNLWSEYHARKRGYYFLRSILNIITNNITNQNQYSLLEHIINTEMPYHINTFFNEYSNTNNSNQQLYHTMQFIGRYSAWCDMFPDYINESTLASSFTENNWLFRILLFLRNNESIDDIYSNFYNMKVILKENWSNL